MSTHDVARLTRERFEHTRPPDKRMLPKVDFSILPRGPRLPVLVQSTGLLRFRHQFVPWLRRKYGAVVTLRLIPEKRPLVLFSKPEFAKEIFAGDPEVFHAGKGNAILGPIMGQHSILLLDGADHRRVRRMLMPAFTGQTLKGYRSVVAEVARGEVASWPQGVPFASLERMNALTLEVILRVVFGVTDEERLARLRPLVNRTVDVSPVVLLAWSFPFLQRFGVWKRTVATSYELDRLLYAEIARRREAPDLEARTDVLSQLIRLDDGGDRLTDPELRDQLVTLLLAGHETTATALSWALYELGRDREQLTRAQAAADSGDDTYLDAVFKESTRLHPVIAMVLRTLMAPARIGGRDLPWGTTVAPSILLSHRDPANFPEPERFRPERFVGPELPALNTWIPFGGGARRCLGAAFSQMEAVEVLREVLTHLDLRAVEEERPKVRNITSVPRHGARLVVTPRASGKPADRD